MTRGVGLDLGAVKTDVTQLEQLHFLGQLQHLHKQVAQFVKETSPERGQAIVIGMAPGGDVAERDRIVGRPLQLAAGEETRRVAIDQNLQQRRRMVRFRSTSRVLPNQIGKIKLIDHLNNESRQVILIQPVVYRRRQQIVGLAVGDNEIGHGRTRWLELL